MSTWYRDIRKYKHQVIIERTMRLPYQLWQGLSVKNDFLELLNGKLEIKVGYAWDGASGPVIQTKALIKASVYHDALYQVLREVNLTEYIRENLRLEADRQFKKIYLNTCLIAYPTDSLSHKIGRAVARRRANYVYWAVRKFGKKSVQPKKVLSKTGPS